MSSPLEASLTLFGVESIIPDWSEALGFAGAIAHTALSGALDRDGQAYRVVAFEGEEAIDELYRFELQIVVPGHVDLEEAALGVDARLDLTVGERSRPVHGIVTAVEVVDSVHYEGEHATSYRVVLGPKAHLLTLRRDSRAYQGLSAKDVIEDVLRPYLIPVQFHLRTRLPVRPYLCQVDETDFEFLRRIAAAHGLFLCFEQPASFAEAAIDGGLEAVVGAITSGRLDAGGLGSLASGRPREVMVFSDHASYGAVTFDGGQGAARRLLTDAAASVVNLGARELGGALEGAGAAGGIAMESLSGLADRGLDALDEAPELAFQRAHGGGSHEERVIASLKRSMRLSPERATLREYDPRRPLATQDHEAEAEHEGLEGYAHKALELGEQLHHAVSGGHGGHGGHGERGGHGEGEEHDEGDDHEDDGHAEKYEHRPFEVYEHGGHPLHPEWDYDRHRPERILRRERAEHSVAHGESPCPWLAAGHRFALTEHPVERLNASYAIARVHHHAARDEHDLHYANHFECFDASHAHLGQFLRPVVSTVMTAVVVGGGDVHTDNLGQVQVRFHWDRARGRGPSTCWLRVMQPWAGAGWGMQFLPRVGTEVAVGFEGGNPDRPIVLGGVYNAAQPWPFTLPASATKSGIRTRSVPHGEAGNELSFEDRADRELVYLHATRDYQVETRNDRIVSVGHDDRLHVAGGRHVRVDGTSEATTHGSHSLQVEGGHTVSVQGRHQVTVTGTSQLEVTGTHHHAVTELDRVEVGGRREVEVAGDSIHRYAGHHVSVVGTSDAPKTMACHVEGDVRTTSSGRIEIAADEEIVLRVGTTTLRLGPHEAVLSAGALTLHGEDVRALLAEGACKVLASDTIQLKAETILLKSSGAGLGLSSEAKVDGSKILLNSPLNAEDQVEDATGEPTHIELTDDSGEPIPHQMFRIVLPDGREVAGILDSEGKATLDLAEGGDIFFPGLHGVRER